MKHSHFIIYILFLFFLNCSKNKSNDEKNSTTNLDKDSLSLFLKKIDENKSIKYTNSAFNNIVKSNKNDLLVRNNLYKIAESFSNLNDSKSLKKSAKLLLSKSIEKKDTLNIANSYILLANEYFKNFINDSAYYYYLKAEKNYLLKGNDKKLGIIYLNKSTIQLNINDLYGAEYSATQSVKYLKKDNNFLGEYDAYTNLGIIANESENYDRAIEYHKSALKIAQNYNKENNYYLEEVSLNNIGNTYQNSKRYDEAIIEFNKALTNNNILKFKPSLYATLIDNIAYSKFKKNDFENLPNLFIESLKIRDSLKLNSKIIFSKIHLSEFYFYKNDSLNAKLSAREALALSRKTKYPLDILASLKQLSIVDKNNSTSFSKEYFKISDSLQIAERNSKDRFARIQFETDELRKENVFLSERAKNILNYFFAGTVIAVILFLYRLQRMRARELVLKQAQQVANEEIYRLIISHQNQLEEGRDMEKKRISKELHDGVLGRLFGLRLNLDGLNNFDDEKAKQDRLNYLGELKLIEQDLREISHELNRENLVLINNFLAIIDNLVSKQAETFKTKIKLINSEQIDWDNVSNIYKINMYRILQEALQNINKYAGAKSILVQFDKDSKENLLFSIEDDGKGYDVNIKKNKGIGLKNIRSRVKQCGGVVDIKSEIGKGSKIIITFPPENQTQ